MAEELLYEFGAAFTYRHGAEGAVTGVAVGAQNHLAAGSLHFAHVLMDDRKVGRDIVAAVFFCGGEAEHVVILVDSSADGAQRIVTVCEGVWNREFCEA